MTTARLHTPATSLDDLEALKRTFSIETARDIAKRVGPPPLLGADHHNPEIEAAPEDMLFAQLAHQLNKAAFDWGWNQRRQTSANPAMRAALADKIASRCAGLLAIMRGPDGELLDSLGPKGLWAQAGRGGAANGREEVDRALSALDDLQGWAGQMASRNSRDNRDKSPGRGQRPDEAFKKLLATLGDTFASFWDRPPGLSRPAAARGNQTPDGPFFRFVSAVMDELDTSKTDEALATAISQNPSLRARVALMSDEWQ